MHKLHHNLDLHFLITGHTKLAPTCASASSIRPSERPENTLSEIAGVVKDSTVTGVNIQQLVGLKDGTVLMASYGWQQHLTLYFMPLPQIKQYQHLSFDALGPGVVAKERLDCRDQVSAAAQRLHPSSHRWSACKSTTWTGHS